MRPSDTSAGNEEGKRRDDLVPLAAVAFVAGVFFRFWDLGGAPLAVDEYYLGTSILNVAERGLPQFAAGGFYNRGLLLQYLSLPLLGLGASLEFTVRFWPAVASVLSIVAVWRIGVLTGVRGAASIAVILMSLSVWEVEFARFGRMYAPFQAVFLWYMYYQIKHLVGGRDGALRWYLGLSAISIFLYEGAVMLLAFNFLPLIWSGRRWTAAHLTVAVALLGLGSIYYTVDFRHLGLTPDQLLPVPANASAPSFRLPIDTPSLPSAVLPIIALGIAFVAILFSRYRGRLRRDHPSVIFWALAMVCLCFGLLALGAALVVSGLLMRLPTPLREVGLPRNSLLGWGAVLFVSWLVILVLSFSMGGADVSFNIKNALRYLLDYPDVYHKVVFPWMTTIPVTTIALGILVLAGLWAVRNHVRNRKTDTAVVRYLVAALILLVLLVAILEQPYAITRYTYFLYPLVIILASVGVSTLAATLVGNHRLQLVAAAALVTALFASAEDFRLDHLIKINEPEFRYRTAYTAKLADHYYTRWDFRSAAFYVNERLAANDRVIVFDRTLPHYLDHTSGVFVREGTGIHRTIWACSGDCDLWSNAPLLDQDSEVQSLIDEATGDVWFLMRTNLFAFRDVLESSLVDRYDLAPQFTSKDGHLVVYRLSAPNQPG